MSTTDTTDSTTCQCGGCATGTPCCHSGSYIQRGDLGATYVYAAPSGLPTFPRNPDDPLGTVIIKLDGTTADTRTSAPDAEAAMRKTLQDEMLTDLLHRVQKLEQELADLRKQLSRDD